MTDVLNTKAGEFSIVDGLIITGFKVTSDIASSRFALVGNGTFKSGIIKTVGAIGLSMVSKNKYVQYASTGVLIDACEDLIGAGLRMWANKNSNANSEEIYQI
jgi:hypothetical protein